MGKNCDLGLENAALGLRPRAAFSRPQSQFFPIRTSQPANNIYIYIKKLKKKGGGQVVIKLVLDVWFCIRGVLIVDYLFLQKLYKI